MNFDLSDEHKMLQEQARRYLADRLSYDALRKAILAEQPMDAALWAEMSSLGWQAAAIPEPYGGLGLGVLGQCVIAQELGRCVAPVPFVSSAGLAAEAILRAGSEAQKQRWLPAIASGEVIATVAFFEGSGAPDAADVTRFETTASDFRLTGRKWPVLDAGVANLLIVAARSADGAPGLYLVETSGAGITVEPVPGFDQLRWGYSVTFAGTVCERLEGDATVAIEAMFDVAAVLTAFEQIGGAESALEMSRSYAIERTAFGRAIGSFQAIKHKLADMLTKIELARSNAYYAGWALSHDAHDRSLAAAATRLSATEAYEFAARENMQVHGGISFTWEANCHFHYRRSRLLALWPGTTAYWSRRLMDALLADPAQAQAG
jgi:acyl-CoA dehydrogenase